MCLYTVKQTETETLKRSHRLKRCVGSYNENINDSSTSDEALSSPSSSISRYSKSSSSPSSPMQVKHICKFCMKEFPLNCILQRHRCEKMISIPSYTCDKCEKVYNRKDRLASHMRSKHNQNPTVKHIYHNCDMCDKTFTRLPDMNRHKSVIHLQQKSEHQKTVDVKVMAAKAKKSSDTSLFKCLQCEKQFSTRYNLKMHVQVLHDKVKDFKCLSCPKTFGLKVILDKHVQAVHLKKDPSSMYQCTKCYLCFTQKSNLTTHQQVHDSNRKLFKCAVCKQTYTRKAALDKHSCPYN